MIDGACIEHVSDGTTFIGELAQASLGIVIYIVVSHKERNLVRGLIFSMTSRSAELMFQLSMSA